MALSDAAVRNIKATDKPRKLSDERGLYLLINKAGKYWRFDYRYGGKRKTFSIGVYPDVSLAQARERCNQARTLLANGADPAVVKQASKAATENSFEAITREWHAKFSPGWVPHHADKIIKRFEREVFPWRGIRHGHLGNNPG